MMSLLTLSAVTFAYFCCFWTLASGEWQSRNMWWLVSTAYSVRLLTAVGLYFISYWGLPILMSQQGLPGFWNFAPDASMAHQHSVRILETGFGGSYIQHLTTTDSSSYIFWVWIVARAYWLFSPHPLNLIIFNIILGTTQVLLTVWIMSSFVEKRQAIRLSWLVALWPSSILWSTQILKDTLCTTLIMAILGVTVKLLVATTSRASRRAYRTALAALLFGCLFVLLKLRPYMGIITIGTITVACVIMLVFATARKQVPVLKHVLGVLALVFVTAISIHAAPSPGLSRILPDGEKMLLGADNGRRFSKLDHGGTDVSGSVSVSAKQDPKKEEKAGIRFPNQLFSHWAALTRRAVNEFTTQLSPSSIVSRRKGLASEPGRSTIATNTALENVGDFWKYLPRALIIMWFSPFPSQWFNLTGSTGIFQSFAGIETLFLYIMMPWLCRGAWRFVRYGGIWGWCIPVFIVSASIILALVNVNIGTIYRLRTQFMIPFLMIGALGFSARTNPRLQH